MYQKDGCSQKLQCKYYNGKKHTEWEEGGGRVKDMEFQAGKVPKKPENFSGIAYSVLMSLGHFRVALLVLPTSNNSSIVKRGIQ